MNLKDPHLTPPEIVALHADYERATGFQLRTSYTRIAAWAAFVRGGFTRADMALVIAYLKREIARGQRNAGALKFSNLVEQLDRFEEDLCLARKFHKSPGKVSSPSRPHAHPIPPRSAWTLWLKDKYPEAEIPDNFADLPDYIQAEYHKC